MAKVKIYNQTSQLINLSLLEAGKEVSVPLVSNGCIGTTSEKLTPDITRLVKKGFIKLERGQEPSVAVIKPSFSKKNK